MPGFKRNILTNKGIEIEGIEELAATVSKLGEAVSTGRQVHEVMLRAAFVARDEVKDLVPVRTGTLKSAVFAGRGDPSKYRKGPTAIMGVSAKIAPHRHLVEFGTVKMAARPYFRPGINASRPMVARVIADGLKDVIDKAL